MQFICRKNKSQLVLGALLYNEVINAFIIYNTVAVLARGKGSCRENLAARVTKRSDRGVQRINEVTSMSTGSRQCCGKWSSIGADPVNCR